jgi:hypothetical protein
MINIKTPITSAPAIGAPTSFMSSNISIGLKYPKENY